MPFLDVSDILADPDFADGFAVTRAVQTVSSAGLATQTTTTTAASGVVQAGTGDVLNLLPESARVSGTIEIHTTFRLKLATGTGPADVVTWGGQDYLVTQLNDYSTFGAGYVMAICTLRPLVVV